MTILVDDAGSGDLLFGVVIGAYRQETNEFKYDVIDVHFYQNKFKDKEYLKEASKIATKLVAAFNPNTDEEIHICQGCIFDTATEDLYKIYGEKRIKRIHIEGEAQRLIEIAYLDEIRNLGYEPLTEREEKRAKNFFHMMRWLKNNPKMLKYAKTGWPKLKNYQLFKQFHNSTQQNEHIQTYKTTCNDCKNPCEVTFQPETTKPAYCKKCWKKHKSHKPIKRHIKNSKNKK
ncbi:MAG: hypothetical protein FWH37_08620 [Candidatus Bathyarchaeota archaeon]|nr:hypothetical protein [Candidatus Termiticorpusculum sp.]